jgi:hypothetical protein
MLKIRPIVCLALVALYTACTSQEENNRKAASAPSYNDTNNFAPDTLQRNKREPEQNPGNSADELDKKESTSDWRTLLKQYHEIVCRQHNGVNTGSDKIELARLNGELNLIQTKLTQTERSEFISEKAKAINTETCP